MGLDRRSFLRGAVAAGGALALGQVAPRLAKAAQDAPNAVPPDVPIPGVAHLGDSLLNLPAASAPIDTIVVICMENRSFDHYFGYLGSDEGFLERGRSRYGAGFTVDGSIDEVFLRPDGSEATTFHLAAWEESVNAARGCGGHPDPGHGWNSGRAQRDRGFVAEGSGNDDFAIGYFLGQDLPCYDQLVRQGTVFDRYFCSLLTSTFPNREYLHSGQSQGRKTNELERAILQLGFTSETIWDRLNQAGVPAALYGVDLPTTALWGPKLLSNTRPIANLFLDAALGTLPNVVFVDPGFLTGLRTDDHPHGDMRMGQRFVASVISALQASPAWERMAIFVTYDEWGGFYDHVTPPLLPDERASADDAENFSQAGFRLPVTLVSPYARPGFVDHRTYDHTSILRFIQWRFLGAPAEGPGGAGWWLTERNRAANNIGAALSADRQTDAVIDVRQVPLVVSLPCNGDLLNDVPLVGDLEKKLVRPLLDGLQVELGSVEATVRNLPVVLSSAPSQFELMARSGMFERRGYEIAPTLSLRELLAG